MMRATRLSLGNTGRKTYTPSPPSQLPRLCCYHPIPGDRGRFPYLHPFHPLQAQLRPFRAGENHPWEESDSALGTPWQR